MSILEIFRVAYEKAKTPTSSVADCERAGLEAVSRNLVHMCADLLQLQVVNEAGDGGKPVQRALTQSECVHYLRRLCDPGT